MFPQGLFPLSAWATVSTVCTTTRPHGVALRSVFLLLASLVPASPAALPEADPGIYLAMSLGITFPFNIIIGISLYTQLATAIG